MFLSSSQKDNEKIITMKNIFCCRFVRFCPRYILVNFSICIICFPFGFDAVCTIIMEFQSDGDSGQIFRTEAATRGSCVMDLVKDFKQAKPMHIVLL